MNPTPLQYEEAPNAELEACCHCGGDESHDKRCPEMTRCPECWAAVDAGESHDWQCTRAEVRS